MCSGRVVGARDLPIQGAEPGGEAPVWSDADLNLERMERHLVELALSRTQQNVTQAAKLLGVSRDTLRYRLERLGLKSNSSD
jgi:two-component system, NtrC family, response regulator AtoC